MLDNLLSRKLLELEKLKLKTQLAIVRYSFWVYVFPLGGVQGGEGPPNINLGPHIISEIKILRYAFVATFYYVYILRNLRQ